MGFVRFSIAAMPRRRLFDRPRNVHCLHSIVAVGLVSHVCTPVALPLRVRPLLSKLAVADLVPRSLKPAESAGL